MKRIIIFFLSASFFLLFPTLAQAQDSTTTFKVWGVCEMCKHRIEEAAQGKGVTAATWSEDSKLLSLTFDPKKTSLDKIHNRIAAAGHDTYVKKAADAVYNGLPDCCRYREFDSMEDMGKEPTPDTTVTLPPDTATHTTTPAAPAPNTIRGVVLEEDGKGNFTSCFTPV